MLLEEKYIRNQNFKLQLRLKNKNAESEKNYQNLSRLIFKFQENLIWKISGCFWRGPRRRPLNAENFFIDDNDIFDSEEISNADREFIIDPINRTNLIADAKKFVKGSNDSKMEIFIVKNKIEKKVQMLIDDDKKRENTSVKNSLMKKVKIKNEFEGEQKNTKR